MMEIGARPRTRMTRIGRIFTDTFNPCASAQSVFHRNSTTIENNKKPQINADERRYFPASDFIKTIHRKVRKERKATQHKSLRSCAKKIRYGINNELVLTDTNSRHSEFVRVRISSLLISVLNLLYVPAHGRAPMQPALRPRMSRAGG